MVLRHVRARASQIDRVGLLIGDKQSGSVSTNFHFPFPADAVKVPGRAGGRFRPPSAPPPSLTSAGGGAHLSMQILHPAGWIIRSIYSPGKQLNTAGYS